MFIFQNEHFIQTSMPQIRPSGITVSQIACSQPQQLLHVSNLQMQQQGNQILQIPSLVSTQGSQTVSQSNSVSQGTLQMSTPASVPNNQQAVSSVGVSQSVHVSSNTPVNQLSSLPTNNQSQGGKLTFVQQQLLIQGQQSNQSNSLIHPQQQALILQRRSSPLHQRILLQQQLVTQGGVTTTHWRPGNIVSFSLFYIYNLKMLKWIF